MPRPENIAGYAIVGQIARGGMGIVYQARDGAGRRVALKLMQAGARAEVVLQEALLLALVDHPNVVEVLDHGEHAGGRFIVMRYIDGPSLRQLRRWARERNQPLPRPVGLRILIDALAGLHAVHEATTEGVRVDLIHRDFTPENILIRSDGTPVLVDFGVARALSQPSTTAQGMLKGKIQYMSPEQVRGEPLDRRSDVFSAGVVAWELLTGRRPFRRTSDLHTLIAIGRGARPGLREVAPDVPTGIAAAVEQALALERDHRYHTAQAFAAALTHAAEAAGWLVSAAHVRRHLVEVMRDSEPDASPAPPIVDEPVEPPLDRGQWAVLILALVAVAIVSVSLAV